MNRAIFFRRDEAFDPHEIGAYDISIVTRDGNATSLSISLAEAKSLCGDMLEEFEEISSCDSCGKAAEELHVELFDVQPCEEVKLSLCTGCEIEMLQFLLQKMKYGEDEEEYYGTNRAVVGKFKVKGN